MIALQLTVLLIEDNKSLSSNIIDVLMLEGFKTFYGYTVQEGKDMVSNHNIDIVLLDIMLPDAEGTELIPIIKKMQPQARIIMLTALSSLDNKVTAYENGADDYIIKPFDLYELTLKLSALRKRILLEKRRYTMGDIVYDMDQNQIISSQKAITLPPSQQYILKTLIENNNKPYVNKEVFFGNTVDESHRLQTFIGRLRDNLNAIGAKEVRIDTVYGKGYKLVIGGEGFA